MKVYKFRSLGDCQSLERAEEIIGTGKFWCSRFWEMNDPMEGIYRLDAEDDFVNIANTFNDKSNALICSFSHEDVLKNPLMWGYYANGFKGIAIEVTVNPEDLRAVNYTSSVVRPDRTNIAKFVDTILCNKLKPWEHEGEYRFIKNECNTHLHKIGEVAGVILGRSYPKARNNPDKDRRHEELDAYEGRLKRIIDLASDREISIRRAIIANGEVQIENYARDERSGYKSGTNRTTA